LDPSQAEAAAEALAAPVASIEEKAGFLGALARKGETPGEVGAFAKAFRGKALDPGLEGIASEAIDVVGTGGDQSGTFNFSTAAGLLLASLGVPVMKHGNRSITSRSGSADLLGNLAVPFETDRRFLRESMERFRFCFFFAPSFHPAFKEIMPARKKLAETGQRTIFNLLGPLINPGRPAHQLMGVFAAAWAEPIAMALDGLGLRAALVVHSATGPSSGVDELTVAGDNVIVGAGRLRSEEYPSAPEAYGLVRGTLADLQGGEAEANAALLRDLADGKGPAPLEDTLCFNAGAALFVTGRVDSVVPGIDLARTALRDGSFREWLGRFETFNRERS
jgi:anthranilate phosphoribosyltransferase